MKQQPIKTHHLMQSAAYCGECVASDGCAVAEAGLQPKQNSAFSEKYTGSTR
jgi:hypothetical protein